jgi:hypothetical protein
MNIHGLKPWNSDDVEIGKQITEDAELFEDGGKSDVLRVEEPDELEFQFEFVVGYCTLAQKVL